MLDALSLTTDRRPKLLVLELWGLGDLTFSTPVLRAAVERFDVTLVGKGHAKPLLGPSFPEIEFVAYEAPWSAYLGKYQLWRWHWAELLRLLAGLRKRRFDAAISVRNDPRDHLFLFLTGARQRFGFPVRGSSALLTDPLLRSQAKQHKVEDWRDLGAALGLPEVRSAEPALQHERYESARVEGLFSTVSKPLVCLHPGARIAVRRWREDYFASLVERLREAYDFHLVLIPDVDGYGSRLAPMADSVLPNLTVTELVDVLGRSELVICNDSGPGHIAASCGRPAIVVFGPTDPDWFRPWGGQHHLVIRDICPWRPCFDYCKFSEPYCLTKLVPDRAWPDIHQHIEQMLAKGELRKELRRT